MRHYSIYCHDSLRFMKEDRVDMSEMFDKYIKEDFKSFKITNINECNDIKVLYVSFSISCNACITYYFPTDLLYLKEFLDDDMFNSFVSRLLMYEDLNDALVLSSLLIKETLDEEVELFL